MKRIRTKALLLASLTSLIAMTSCGGGSKKTDTVVEPVSEIREKVTVETVERKAAGRTVDYPCTLIPFEDNYLAPASPGRIEKIYVEIGSKVDKGQTIAQMDRTQLIQAEIQLAALQLDYDRLDTLARLGSIAKQKYDQIKAQYDAAKTNVDFLKENTRLLAPISGVISEKYYENGELYNGAPSGGAPKAALVHLIQTDNLKALVPVPEKYLPTIKHGMNIDIRTEVYDNEIFPGTVNRIYPTIDPTSHNFQVEIKIPNHRQQLRPGMYAHVVIELAKDEALTVPAAAVLKLQGSNDRYVFIVDNNRAKRVTVTLDRRFDDRVEIVSKEIQAGDKIVTKGQARLSDGAEIQIINN